VRALLSQSPDIRLFAVGDDWQSIYRFAGSDISLMTQFEKEFGFTVVSFLSRTFRCNKSIARASTAFVLKNPAQIRKSVHAMGSAARGAILCFMLRIREPLSKRSFEL